MAQSTRAHQHAGLRRSEELVGVCDRYDLIVMVVEDDGRAAQVAQGADRREMLGVDLGASRLTEHSMKRTFQHRAADCKESFHLVQHEIEVGVSTQQNEPLRPQPAFANRQQRHRSAE